MLALASQAFGAGFKLIVACPSADSLETEIKPYAADMGVKGTPTPAPYQIVAALVDTLLAHGYSEEDCGKFLGGNSYRVFSEVWI